MQSFALSYAKTPAGARYPIECVNIAVKLIVLSMTVVTALLVATGHVRRKTTLPAKRAESCITVLPHMKKGTVVFALKNVLVFTNAVQITQTISMGSASGMIRS